MVECVFHHGHLDRMLIVDNDLAINVLDPTTETATAAARRCDGRQVSVRANAPLNHRAVVAKLRDGLRACKRGCVRRYARTSAETYEATTLGPSRRSIGTGHVRQLPQGVQIGLATAALRCSNTPSLTRMPMPRQAGSGRDALLQWQNRRITTRRQRQSKPNQKARVQTRNACSPAREHRCESA
jgi:hypothetical protein